eukprot:TRINITY_DN7604_c0_g1_i1.p1 TRINITY_DN7604_c0_g1~~TRINITY_DN7604_c0_g1_i1.p1  ORF type:complete len:370 (-),score=55.63 TRINITY_DN7604_c0_g1_i1:35-1144(-)
MKLLQILVLVIYATTLYYAEAQDDPEWEEAVVQATMVLQTCTYKNKKSKSYYVIKHTMPHYLISTGTDPDPYFEFGEWTNPRYIFKRTNREMRGACYLPKRDAYYFAFDSTTFTDGGIYEQFLGEGKNVPQHLWNSNQYPTVERIFEGDVRGIECDVENDIVYWTDVENPSIWYKPTKTSAPEVFYSQSPMVDDPYDLALDDTYLYWTNKEGYNEATSNGIWKTTKGVATVGTKVYSTGIGSQAFGLGVDDEYLYFTLKDDNLYRITKDGRDLFLINSEFYDPGFVHVDNATGWLMATDEDAHDIFNYKEGTYIWEDPHDLITNQEEDIFLDAGYSQEDCRSVWSYTGPIAGVSSLAVSALLLLLVLVF